MKHIQSTIEVAPGMFQHTCSRCGNKWYSKNKSPGTCSAEDCRSKYWNKARVRKTSTK